MALGNPRGIFPHGNHPQLLLAVSGDSFQCCFRDYYRKLLPVFFLEAVSRISTTASSKDLFSIFL